MVQTFMRDGIEKSGFVDVVEIKYKWPIGAWSTDAKLKELGKWNLNHWEDGLEGWTMRFFTRYLGVSEALPKNMSNTLTIGVVDI